MSLALAIFAAHFNVVMKLLKYLIVVLMMLTGVGKYITGGSLVFRAVSVADSELVQFYSADDVLPWRMVEPNSLAMPGPVQSYFKLSKWQSLPVESLPINLLPQVRYVAGRKSAGVRCVKVSWLLFPFHEFW